MHIKYDAFPYRQEILVTFLHLHHDAGSPLVKLPSAMEVTTLGKGQLIALKYAHGSEVQVKKVQLQEKS
jgi:hypothetical protein